MRKVKVLAHISLDGVIQAPGSPEEDPSGGFAQGGWIVPWSDTILGTALRKQMNTEFDLLLGRRTYDHWEPYWPGHDDIWPQANRATKYIASNTRTSGSWQQSVFLSGDTAGEVARIKQQEGPELHVWGSGHFAQTLLRHGLVDAFWLMIYPVTLGRGKRLFADGTLPASFTVGDVTVSSKGVIIVSYVRA